MDITTLILFFIGFFLLGGGADLLVRGASKLAVRLGIEPLVVGLTIVAFGTSAPELAVNVQASYEGQPDLVIGNVVGSNIANVLLILGVAAIITRMTVSVQLVRLDVPLMVIVSILAYALAWDGAISFWDGLLLFSGAIGYTVFAIYNSGSSTTSEAVQAEYAQEYGSEQTEKQNDKIFILLVYIVIGLVLLVVGSNWLVDGAVMIARYFGVSELIIGLTILAIGTSLPELAASIVASLRGERDIVVGNVVGSNLFNIMLVLGAAALVAPEGIKVSETALNFDILVMIAVAMLCLPIFFTGHSIDRWEGALFLLFYSAYLAFLGFSATQSEYLPAFNQIMLWVVFPITVLTLLVTTGRDMLKR